MLASEIIPKVPLILYIGMIIIVEKIRQVAGDCYRESYFLIGGETEPIVFKGEEKVRKRRVRKDERIAAKVHCFDTIDGHTCTNFLRKSRRGDGTAGANRISRVAH